MNRKASAATDIFLFMIVIFIMAVSLVVYTYVGNQVQTSLLANANQLQANLAPGDNATDIINNSVGKMNASFVAFQWISVTFIFFYAMSLLITSFLVKTHPVFFIAYIFIMLLAVIVSAIISNSYETLTKDPSIGSAFTGFFAQNWIFHYFPIWITVIGFIAGILMFANIMKPDVIA